MPPSSGASPHQPDSTAINVETALQRELKIEFCDLNWLCSSTLDSEVNAMDYFYLSPFYMHQREGTLNELVRSGQDVDPSQSGLLFMVTYSNLEKISADAPSTSHGSMASRIMYFNEKAIFHIKLVSREVGYRGLSVHPRKAYMILEGRIYRAAPLSDVLVHRMFNAVRHFERCFDKMQGMSHWNLMEGYSWRSVPDPEEERYINRLAAEFEVGSKARESWETGKGSSRARTDDEKVVGGYGASSQVHDSAKVSQDSCPGGKDFSGVDAAVRSHFNKWECTWASRVAQGEQERLRRCLVEVEAKREKLDDEWQKAREQESQWQEKVEQLKAEVRLLRARPDKTHSAGEEPSEHGIG